MLRGRVRLHVLAAALASAHARAFDADAFLAAHTRAHAGPRLLRLHLRRPRLAQRSAGDQIERLGEGETKGRKGDIALVK